MGTGSTQGLPAQIVYGALSVDIWGIRALRAHIKTVDKVRVQAPVGEIEVKVQEAMRRRQKRLGLVMLWVVV
jgi:hypothetical protein